MKFYFCEKCGVRLTEKDIAAGAGKDKKLAGVYCTACAAGVLTMELLPVTDEEIAAQKAAAKAPPPQPPTPVQPPPPRRPPAARRTTSSATVPAHRSPGNPAHARPHREPNREPNSDPRRANTSANKVPVIAFAAGGLLVVVALLVVFNSGGATPNRSASTADDEIPEAQAPDQAAPAKPDAPAQAKKQPAPARSEPVRTAPKAEPAPVQPHPRILQLPDNEDLKKELACYRPFEFGDVTEKKLAAMEEPQLEEGLFGRAFRFNGKPKNAGGIILAGSGVRNADANTVALWIRCAVPSQQAAVLENRNRYRLALDGETAVWTWTQEESNHKLEVPLPQAKQDWMHLAWTCDGKKAIAYLNGAPVASLDAPGGMIGTKGDGGYTIRIGGRFLTSGMDGLPTYDGWMDELRVYTRALSPAEIALLAKDPRAK